MRNGRSPVLWLIGILCPLVSVLFSCEEGFVDINLHSDVVCGLIWHRSKGVMCEIWRRTREIPISVDIIIFRADKLWQIVRWNLYLSKNLFGNFLRHEGKTFPLNLMYISFLKCLCFFSLRNRNLCLHRNLSYPPAYRWCLTAKRAFSDFGHYINFVFYNH